MISIRCFR